MAKPISRRAETQKGIPAGNFAPKNLSPPSRRLFPRHPVLQYKAGVPRRGRRKPSSREIPPGVRRKTIEMNQPTHPAATVAPLRAGPHGMEVLLLRRNPALAFHGGAWVFPGGRVDHADRVSTEENDPLAAARRAAVREAREEADLTFAPDRLTPISRWTTPPGFSRRFVAWVFLAEAETGRVRVDGGEIHEHRWMSPGAALMAHETGDLPLPPPTFITLVSLSGQKTPEEALKSAAARKPRFFVPRILEIPGGRCSLYPGDAGYAARDLDRDGPRHRLWMTGKPWRYECSMEETGDGECG